MFVQILGACHFPLGHLVEKRGSLLHCTRTEGFQKASEWACEWKAPPSQARGDQSCSQCLRGWGWLPWKTTAVDPSVVPLGQLALLEAVARGAGTGLQKAAWWPPGWGWGKGDG